MRRNGDSTVNRQNLLSNGSTEEDKTIIKTDTESNILAILIYPG